METPNTPIRRNEVGVYGEVKPAKLLPVFVVCSGLLVTNGCMSTHLIKDKAQPHLDYAVADQQLKEVPGEPRYYALLPLTVIGDIATSPFRMVYFLVTDDCHWGSVSVDGVPIPLP